MTDKRLFKRIVFLFLGVSGFSRLVTMDNFW